MKPSSAELLDLLISLYAEQEHVKITYELKEKPCERLEN